MYYLMNQDTKVASFNMENNRWHLLQQYSEFPLGKFDVGEWLEDRKAYKHNHHLKQLMIDCGCETTEGFIKITHAASINDTFWIKSEKENVTWDDISFYKNDFNETISKLAFEGLGLYGIQMSSTSPELTTDGSFRKCWKKEKEGIYLYKRGVTGAYNAGLEPYCEALASEIIHKADPTSVEYSILRLHKEVATKCKIFTNDNIGFVPLRRLVNRSISLDGLLEFYEVLGCKEQFQRILVLDAITFNVDRHLGNIGILVDNSTQKPVGIAPNFDFNLSMLPYVTKEEFDQIGTKLLDYGPAIGSDFTRVGQEMLTSEIRKDLIKLQGFQFSFRGDKNFKPWRVDIMEDMVHQQIQAVLKGDILYTRDVFVPETMDSSPLEMAFDNEEEMNMAADLANRLKALDIFLSVLEGIMEDGHACVISTVDDGGNCIDFSVSMQDFGIFCEKDGIEIVAEEEFSKSKKFSDAYNCVCQIVDEFYEECMMQRNITEEA